MRLIAVIFVLALTGAGRAAEPPAEAPQGALFVGELGSPEGSWRVFALGLVALTACFGFAIGAHRRIVAGAPRHAIPPGLGRIASTPQPVQCAACGGEAHPAARACGCGATLSPVSRSEVPLADTDGRT